jgi:biotin synthase
MAGIPGQSYQSLARDIQLFEALDLEMIAIGPYLSHPATPLGAGELSPPLEEGRQVPNTEDRVCPRVHIPPTAQEDCCAHGYSGSGAASRSGPRAG